MMLNRSLIIAAAVMVLVSAPVLHAQQPVAAKSLSVNQLAAKPEVCVGKVSVVGRVAAVAPGKGFTLIDSVNCATCATECLTDKATKKIPFLWKGAAPTIKDLVQVDGILAKTAKGYVLTAERLAKQ